MRALLPFLKLFKLKSYQLWLGVLLMLLGLMASIGLLTLSGWFLAATAIASVGVIFNFFYPSSGVRGLAIGRTAIRYTEKIITHDVTFKILARLRVAVFDKMIPLSPGVLSQYRNSDLLDRLVADVNTLDYLYLRIIAPFMSAIVVISLMTFGLSFANLNMALFIGGTLMALLFIMPWIFYRLGQRFGGKLTHSRSQYRVFFIEFIQAQAELLLFEAHQQSKQQLAQIEKQWQLYQEKETTLAGLSQAIFIFANGIILVCTLWFGANLPFPIGFYKGALLALFAFSALASFEILMPIGAAFLHLGQLIASAKQLNEILEHPPVITFTQNATFNLKNSPIIKMENVSFHYPSRDNNSLEKINFELKLGQKVAILGKTGSGKSSLLQLLVRHYPYHQGQVYLAGKPIEQYSEATLRHAIGMLTQRVHIFSDTLRNNLIIATDVPANDVQLLSVLQQVGLSHLASQEEGLALWLGEGGRPLSGGEQRRLGLARVLLNNAPILILDEPTESLDHETERYVLQKILQKSEDRTLIMVTHRLTYLEKFDYILFMDNGKLVEQGCYDELMKQKKSLFYQLVKKVL